ncbi:MULTISPECIES: alpha-ketoacid dehydrogenase subunit beta [Corynebacterium]|jgi:pyruvate dehydrogenase E1 component beta subunit|uniref:Acetoin:2,6-dichlorophenolindophenol oxidoreductase subunit beta n=1 Tax=Corynebacterium provencense TaxID=1737425 RepID=A0A2Z3YPI0_9CORY|nr:MULTISPECIES: alpha-ketoacid dehydrogenase subunit beta [Corynebacterium]AWT26672.1 Acetoin:2,6-dichlorophenolindophenol oxidoreductase subunit beta [Corynebacterium provencense]MCI1256753.1 alpha-ketoacid dehydrogenase subunit beta [Corynebacterium provencense]
MSKKSFRDAIRMAMADAMREDDHVVLIGEDLRGGKGGTNPDTTVEAFGGVFGVTRGLWTEFGDDRVIDTPITESAILGMAAGAATTGLRPVAELMFMDFFGVAYDMIYNQAAKFRYMFGGKATTPLVVRGIIGAGVGAAAQHSNSPYHLFTSTPGVKVVVPSNAYDARGLLLQSIRDDDPVIFCEHKAMYDLKTEVPDDPYTIPLGVANYTRQGTDVTVVALGNLVNTANTVADKLAGEGISVEVVDPRTTSPLDEEGILESVASTGRAVVVDESAARCGFGHDVTALIATRAFDSLKAPVQLIVPPHSPVPFSTPLEQAWVPSAGRIEDAVRKVMEV